MSLEHPETVFQISPTHPIAGEITHINRELLRLLIHQDLRGAPLALGLDGGVLNALASL